MTELAAAIFVSEGIEEDEEIGAAEIALRMRGALKGFAEAPTVRDRYCLQARAILAAGYVRRDNALEEAAKVVDGFAEEAEEDYEAASPGDVECVRSIRNRLWEVRARIRSLKARG